jgi:hypothetical protein
LFVVILVAFGLATNNRGITRDDGKVDLAGADAEAQPAAADKRFQALCASNATYSRLKEVAFEEAFRIRNADPTNLDKLAASSVVRMEDPVLKSRDEGNGVVVCGGRLILELPPGAERAFEGQRRLAADVEYSAQSAADGSGNVFQLNGAESIIYKLASFGLPAGRTPASNDQVELAEASPPEVLERPEPVEDMDEPQATPAPRATPSPRATAEPEPRPTTQPSPRPTTRPTPRPSPTPTRTAEREEPAREPVRARNGSNPSFSCRAGRSRSEQMVCSSNRLAAKDRAMSSLFYSALADASPEKRRRLRQTRDRFLAYRERCPNEACVAEAYDGRVEEIRDIMAGLE